MVGAMALQRLQNAFVASAVSAAARLFYSDGTVFERTAP
jgi:hypothetical protein